MKTRPGRILLLALGNDILGDDGIALVAAREIRKRAAPEISVQESLEAGIVLMDIMEGYQRVLLLDSIMSGNVSPGTVTEMSQADFGAVSAPSLHYAGLPEVLALARLLKIDFPDQVRILAMEIENPFEFSTSLSTPVANALPSYVQRATSILQQWQTCAPG